MTDQQTKNPGGRPPFGAVAKPQLNTRLDATVIDYLRSTASIAGTIEAAVRGSAGFRAWKRNLKELS